jgi:malate dehydrogenase (oxaloacetate-decarboxylating)
VPYARPSSELAAWSRPRGDGGYSLADVVARLGVTVARARRITDTMITASAQAVAALSEGTAGTSLLPPVTNLRMVSAAVALAVAGAAEKEGLAQAPLHDPVQQVHQAMWRPQYPSFEAI